MKPVIYSAILALAFSACSSVKSVGPVLGSDALGSVDVIASTPTPAPTATPSPTPEPIKAGTIKFEPVDYYTTKLEKELIAKAEIKANEVIHSQCYVDFMLHRKMIQTNGKSVRDVVADIFSLSGVVPVKFYYSRFTSAIAYRSPPEKSINLNRKFISPSSDVCSVATTLVHESLHALREYGHDFKWSPSREYSVNYSSDHAFAKEAYSMSESGNCCI